jgi:sugar-specific transcriptional regulator TrmB
MKPEVVFGLNAGKVWHTLKSKGQLSAEAISKATKLKANDVFAALGWLGREGKIEIIIDGKGAVYKLI